MSIKQFINDKDNSAPYTNDYARQSLKYTHSQTKRIGKSSTHYLTNTPLQTKNRDQLDAFPEKKPKPFRLAKSSTKRKVYILNNPMKNNTKHNNNNNDISNLPLLHLINTKVLDKERSDNELFSITNMNKSKFKFNTFYTKKKQSNTIQHPLFNQPIDIKQHWLINNSSHINNHTINNGSINSNSHSNDNVPIQLFKLKQNYASTLHKYSCQSKPGSNANGCIKTNQDSYLSKQRIFGLSNYSIFGVFDGHGLNGHFVSRFLRDYFLTYYTKAETFNQLIPFRENNIHSIVTQSFMVQSSACAEVRLKKMNIDTDFSGSTGVIVVHIEDILYCMNTGDSRAIYINDEGKVIQITRDHKPNLKDEEKRIRSKGGRVDRAPGAMNLGPYRVWLKREDYPGLAMSRSYGDNIAKSIGVISQPDVYEINLVRDRVRAVVLASDGLWEFISNEMVCSLMQSYILDNDCYGASKMLIKEAHSAWVRNGFFIDDITIIVLFFKCG